MRKYFFPPLFFVVFFLAGNFLSAQEEVLSGEVPSGEVLWYRSNASGIALEFIPSRLAALRNEYCLSVQSAGPGELPEILAPYYNSPYRVELRILYERGGESRRQWIFRDENGLSRLASSGNAALFGGAVSEDIPEDIDETAEAGTAAEAAAGFIEIRNSGGSIEKEIRFEEDLSEWEFRFFYNGQTLVRTETLYKKPGDEGAGPVQVTTDYYRYSRFGSLRAVDRVIGEGAEKTRVAFPAISPGFSAEGEGELAARGIAYTSAFLSDIYSPEGTKIHYTLDGRGRILSEVWSDENGELIGEYQNTWSGGSLQSVLWKSGDDERLVEYEYDGGGNRVTERNYRRGVLERSVTSQGEREIEEIYMNGKIILRAYWEKGMKVSEERNFAGGKAR